MTDTLRQTIEAAFERRAEINPTNVERSLRDAIEECIGLLDSGRARVAEKQDGQWVVNEWLKKAVLLSFRANVNQLFDSGAARYYDKVALKFADQNAAQLKAGGVRVVPPATARRGVIIGEVGMVNPSARQVAEYLEQFAPNLLPIGYEPAPPGLLQRLFGG